ncbi:MAG: type II toxin-antitoxin system HicB family antitoxin [Thermodesulfobacteriota bacterium]
MQLPVCIHEEPSQGFGVSVPDLPGCFTQGETLDKALFNLQDAVELYYEGEDLSLPTPSKISDLVKDKEYCAGGFWMMVDVDFSFLETKHKRVNITLPVSALNEIDKHAKRKKCPARPSWSKPPKRPSRKIAYSQAKSGHKTDRKNRLIRMPFTKNILSPASAASPARRRGLNHA